MLILSVVALGVAGLALRRTDVVERRVRRWLPERSAASDEPGAAAAVGAAELAQLNRRIDGLSGGSRGLARVAVVRYDAFEDLGGRLSFSAAVLDDAGRGFVLTAIHGRSETRSYVKQIPAPADSAQRDLSPEENQAVREAMRGDR